MQELAVQPPFRLNFAAREDHRVPGNRVLCHQRSTLMYLCIYIHIYMYSSSQSLHLMKLRWHRDDAHNLSLAHVLTNNFFLLSRSLYAFRWCIQETLDETKLSYHIQQGDNNYQPRSNDHSSDYVFAGADQGTGEVLYGSRHGSPGTYVYVYVYVIVSLCGFAGTPHCLYASCVV